MITIFSTPKPFGSDTKTSQYNAIRSWKELHPSVEVILVGDDEGVAEAARDIGIIHAPDVECNEYGTPLVNSIFKKARHMAKHPILCYVNADIILLSDFVEAVARVLEEKKRFLIAGQRWNIDFDKPMDFKPRWEEDFQLYLNQNGNLGQKTAMDYFVFPKDLIVEMPPFAIGRPAWDTWMVFNARKLKIPVIDATRVITAVHQNHGYSHISNRRGESYWGPEGDKNLKLLGGFKHAFTLLDVTHLLTQKRLVPAIGYRYFRRRLINLRFLLPQKSLRRKIVTLFTVPIQYLPSLLLDKFQDQNRWIKRINKKILKDKVRRIKSKSEIVKLVVGSGSIKFEGWLITDYPILNALKINDWKSIFKKGDIDRILMEHVVEHFTEEQFRLFLTIVRPFLSRKGFIRIAVPDGFHPDPAYIEHVKPGGTGAGADDHKVLYNYEAISHILEEKDYEYRLLENFDENGKFHYSPWKESDGLIRRSAYNDPRNSKQNLAYTSLIVDTWPKKESRTKGRREKNSS